MKYIIKQKYLNKLITEMHDKTWNFYNFFFLVIIDIVK